MAILKVKRTRSAVVRGSMQRALTRVAVIAPTVWLGLDACSSTSAPNAPETVQSQTGAIIVAGLSGSLTGFQNGAPTSPVKSPSCAFIGLPNDVADFTACGAGTWRLVVRQLEGCNSDDNGSIPFVVNPYSGQAYYSDAHDYGGCNVNINKYYDFAPGSFKDPPQCSFPNGADAAMACCDSTGLCANVLANGKAVNGAQHTKLLDEWFIPGTAGTCYQCSPVKQQSLPSPASGCDRKNVSPGEHRGQPIDLRDGSQWEGMECLSQQGAGIPLSVGITYNTAPLAQHEGAGDLGPGWTMSYARSLSHFVPPVIGSDSLVAVVGDDASACNCNGRTDVSLSVVNGNSSTVTSSTSNTKGACSGNATVTGGGVGGGPPLPPETVTLTNDAGEATTFALTGVNATTGDKTFGRTLAGDAVVALHTNGTYSVQYPDGGAEIYDSTGQLTQIQDRSGNLIKRYWKADAQGNATILALESWPLGATAPTAAFEVTHVQVPLVGTNDTNIANSTNDVRWRVSTIRDASNALGYAAATARTVQLSYDVNARVSTYTQYLGDGQTTPVSKTFVYDGNDYLVQMVDENGAYTVQTTYEAVAVTTGTAGQQGLSYGGNTSSPDISGPPDAVGRICAGPLGGGATVPLLAPIVPFQQDRLRRVTSQSLVKNDGSGTTNYTLNFTWNIPSSTDPKYDLKMTTLDGSGAVLRQQWFKHGNFNHLSATSVEVDHTYAATAGPAWQTQTTIDATTGLVMGTVDPDGVATVIGRDAAGDVTSVAVGGVTQSSATYDSHDRPVVVSDALGRSTKYTYCEVPLPAQCAAANGAVAEVRQCATSSCASTSDLVTTVWTNAAGLVTKTKLPDGTFNTQSYDSGYGRPLQTIRDSTGLAIQTTTTFDWRGYLTSATDARGVTTNITNNARGWPTSVTTAGVTSTITYDNVGNPTQTIADYGTGTLNVTTNTTYAIVGTQGAYAPIEIAEAVGTSAARTSSFAYLANGELASMTDPIGHGWGVASILGWDGKRTVTSHAPGRAGTSKRVYSSAGRLLSSSDELGVTSTVQYDTLGRTSTRTLGTAAANGGSAVNALFTTTYNAANQPIVSSGPSGNSVSNVVYDAFGRTQTVVSGDNSCTQLTYDAMSRVTEQQRGAWSGSCGGFVSTVKTSYDHLGRRTTVQIDPTGVNATTTYSYAPWNGATDLDTFALRGVRDPNGNWTKYQYDSLGRLILTQDAASTQFAFTYDDLGRMLNETGGGGSQTWTYDALGRVLSASQNGNTERWLYRADGKVSVHCPYSAAAIGACSATNSEATIYGYQPVEETAPRLTRPVRRHDDAPRDAGGACQRCARGSPRSSRRRFVAPR